MISGACRGRASHVQPGSKVALEYTLFVEEKLFESSPPGNPRRFTSGTGDILSSLDQELQGLTAGDAKSVVLPPERAYGLRDSKAVTNEPRKAFEGLGAELKPGLVVKGLRAGQAAEARILSVGPDTVTLDFNHPLAGQALRFEVRIVSVD